MNSPIFNASQQLLGRPSGDPWKHGTWTRRHGEATECGKTSTKEHGAKWIQMLELARTTLQAAMGGAADGAGNCY